MNKNNAEATVEIEELTKTFNSGEDSPLIAVNELSLECFPGKIFGLLGPNGAGKTTTLRMLATLLVPTKGEARIKGVNVTQSPARVRSYIGFLATETGLYERLTPVETLRFFGEINGLSSSRLESRISEVLGLLDMKSFSDRRVGQLSTGMRQKLSLARSLLHDPPVLIFDEPTHGLDVMTSKTVRDYIEKFKDRDKTIIISTHIMSVARKLCDDIGILFDGEIEARGSPEDLLESYSVPDLETLFFQLISERGGKQ